jgi:LPXTG-motif cell wall-anchored protein
MKASTTYALLGLAALGGWWWWSQKKKTAAAVAVQPPDPVTSIVDEALGRG